MPRLSATRIRAALAITLSAAALAACSSSNHGRLPVARVKLSDRECLARAMYFESNRSSDAGMLAVGTVVMNRVKSGKYGSSVCAVVGAPRQFAPGVLTRAMTDSGAPRARRVADQVLAGRRHPGVQNAQFFHTAGYKFPYRNMRYVLVAGGNAFYDKTRPPKTMWGGEGRWGPPPPPTERIDGGPIMVAKVEVEDDAGPAAAPAPSRAARHRAIETQVADARAAAGTSARGGSYDGIPVYEPAPGARPSREVRMAALEPSRRPSREAIPEDNGLRVEDRWRDQELAADEGRRPAQTGDDWAARRSERIEQAALPEIETPRARQTRPSPARVASRDLEVYDPAPAAAPSRPARVKAETRVAARDPEIYEPAPRAAPVAAARQKTETRIASRDPAPYDAAPDYRTADPVPVRNERVAARAPRQIDARTRPVAADPAAMGWNVGAQPARTERDDPGMENYRPLTRAASDAGYEVDAPRKASRPNRSYGGVELYGGDSVGYR